MSDILSKDAMKKIEQALKLFKLYMRFKSVGPGKMTTKELMELIRSGMLMNGDKKHAIEAPVMEAYLHTHEQMVNEEAAPKQVREGAMDFLERSMDRYAGKMADQMKTDILAAVENSVMPFQDRREGKVIYQALQDKDLHKKNLRNLLEGQVQNWSFRYKTIVNTELNRAANWGAMDAILHNNPEKDADEIYVFKQGNKPGHGACKYCAQFWYLEDGITPRVYKMSELVANGSNVGRKAKDWKPTVDSTHPNESHVMSELEIGFGFINGKLDFIKHGHNEYNTQRGIK